MSKFSERLKVIFSVLIAGITVLNTSVCSLAADFLPKYKTYSETKMKTSYSDGIIETPDWTDSLIIVELRPDTASIGGTFAECYDLIDFYSELGVNGIWLAPVYDRGGGNGYSNCGPHTIDSALTGKDTYEEGWQELADFVSYAHSKGVYIFLDVITWGVVRGAPLIEEHPDWFNGEAWGNIAFDWSNKELYDWYVKTLVNNILVTDADGFRCDCEPYHSGYDMYREVRETLAKQSKNIIIICEDSCTRSGTYDLEQEGVFDYSVTDRGTVYKEPVNFFGDGILNIVDCVRQGRATGYSQWQANSFKRGKARYYTNCITNHDYQRRDVCGSRINIGYSAIFAPYIPIWYMGDEFNASNNPGVLYDLPVDYSERLIPENAAFLEDVRKMISIRRHYPEIFEYWPSNHRFGNICKVNSEGLGDLQAYARYADNRAVIIAPNQTSSTSGTVTVPFADCGLRYYTEFTVTDLMTGEIIMRGGRGDVEKINVSIPENYVGVYMIEGSEPSSEILCKLSHFVRLLPEKINSFLLELIARFY